MATKRKNYDPKAELQSERSALEKFELNAFKKWLLRHNFALWQRTPESNLLFLVVPFLPRQTHEFQAYR